MKSRTALWFKDIVEYFGFVNARRQDRNGAVFSVSVFSVSATILLACIIYALFYWADPVFLEWSRQPNRQVPEIFQIITRLGSVDWILTLTGVVLIAASLFNAKRFKGHKNIVWHRIFLNAYFAFTAVAFSGLLGNLLKISIGRARPAFTPENYVWLSMPFGHHYQFASFPSGHATTGGAIAMTLMLLFPKWRWYFVPAGLLIAISRPIIGVHFPSDIVAGWLFGGGFVWFYARLFAKKRLLFKFDHQKHLVLRAEGRGKMHLLAQMMRERGNGESK